MNGFSCPKLCMGGKGKEGYKGRENFAQHGFSPFDVFRPDEWGITLGLQ